MSGLWLVGACADNAYKTACDHGHEFDDRNTYCRPGGGRSCRACHRLRQQAYRAMKSTGVVDSPSPRIAADHALQARHDGDDAPIDDVDRDSSTGATSGAVRDAAALVDLAESR